MKDKIFLDMKSSKKKEIAITEGSSPKKDLGSKDNSPSKTKK